MDPVKPLPHAYAHRDCEFRPPLLRSLAAGFSFIEADIYCLLGCAFVAHDPQQLRPQRTLRALYLEPLRQRVQQNGGRVFEDGTSLWLFLDVKTPARASHTVLERALSRYGDMLTSFTADDTYGKPITIILSGNRLPYDLTERFPLRNTALDGRVPDLGVHTNPNVMPIISDNWRKHFSWLGAGIMPANERRKLLEMVHKAHIHGQKLRFWNTPDEDTPERRAVWDTLLEAGVDLINSDDLEGLRAYLEQRAAGQARS